VLRGASQTSGAPSSYAGLRAEQRYTIELESRGIVQCFMHIGRETRRGVLFPTLFGLSGWYPSDLPPLIRTCFSEEDIMQRLVTVLAFSLLVATTAQADVVMVEAMGTVVFNGINEPPLSNVGSGEQVVMSFEVDSDNFVDGIPGDTRGYVIDQPTFELSFSSGLVIGLLDPFPAGETPYFTLVEGFPVSDGFFVSTSPNSPGGVPLAQESINFNLDLGYDGGTLNSLNILDALGTYNFTGLTRFGFNLWRIFPDNVVMDIEFAQMTIMAGPVPVDASSWGQVKATFR
jgi:hypothetical protein